MRAFHNSRDLAYRTPYGAVPVGGTVSLSLDVFDEPAVRVQLRLWSDTRGERKLDMHPCVTLSNGVRYTVEIVCDEPEVLWYRFLVEEACEAERSREAEKSWYPHSVEQQCEPHGAEQSHGATLTYGAQEGRTGGIGCMGIGEVPSFQITVYRPRKTMPKWYTEGLVYQIFPDRFCRGSDWRERVSASLEHARGGPDRVLVEDWSTTPGYRRNEAGGIACWEFSGGTLSGIREKLSYLRNLGVTVLYLNPVFEAASPHRYDVADFLAIDPMLGDEREFRLLCSEARSQGISIVLDGVFNHTGRDSRYFNGFGTYPEQGAWQSLESPYRSWYDFREDGTYECWWGVDDLPAVDGNNAAFRELICNGEQSVVRHWMRAGVRGWRLDVADELEEDFIRDIHTAALETQPDALILGEVWEDASNKISYGKLRHYLLGDELDSVMNYPLRDAILSFLVGDLSALDCVERLESLRENYPPEALYQTLNLLGSHDRARLLTVLGGAPPEASLSEDERASYRLSEGARGLAKARLWLALLVQMSMPGVPCVYYGDEAGLEGYADPYNRAPFPWDAQDADCMTMYRNAIGLRRSLPLFVHGGFVPVSCGNDVFGVVRTATDDPIRAVAVLVNRSFEERDVDIEALGTNATDVIAGREVRLSNGRCRLRIPGLGSCAIAFFDAKDTKSGECLEHPESCGCAETPSHIGGLGRSLPAGRGILAHITSLPNESVAELSESASEKSELCEKPGTLGAPAHRFVDFLADCGMRYWQVLPVNPTDAYGSPYAGISASAGNTLLLEHKGERVQQAGSAAYQTFCSENAWWLDTYVVFMAIKDLQGGTVWQAWPQRFHHYDPALMNLPELTERIEHHRRAQFEFECQWQELHAYAHERGVQIIGDMPMYVSADSADVWAHQNLFELNEKGEPICVAGMPPDRFAAEGQVWGNPTYRWDEMRRDNYTWWVGRLRRAMSLYDYVRLDHFLGFANYFSIPAGASGADGYWRFGPGRELFEVAHEQLGDLPLLVEDLGIITPAVRMLVASCAFPGMDVVQFCDYDVRKGYRPKPGAIAYSSTHDTDTLVGFFREQHAGTRLCIDKQMERDKAHNEEHYEARDEALGDARALLKDLLASDAPVVILSLQDVMLLDSDARMNMPGVAKGNWVWRAPQEHMRDAAELLKSSSVMFCNR